MHIHRLYKLHLHYTVYAVIPRGVTYTTSIKLRNYLFLRHEKKIKRNKKERKKLGYRGLT